MKIVVDAMGGDYGPEETVKGAIQALNAEDIELTIVGDPGAIEAQLKRYDISGSPITVVPSDGKIGDDEHPLQALRHKPHASILVATNVLKKGEADVLLSMGSTGASMASAVLLLGLMEGLDRPCIGGPFLGLAPPKPSVYFIKMLPTKPSHTITSAKPEKKSIPSTLPTKLRWLSANN